MYFPLVSGAPCHNPRDDRNAENQTSNLRKPRTRHVADETPRAIPPLATDGLTTPRDRQLKRLARLRAVSSTTWCHDSKLMRRPKLCLLLRGGDPTKQSFPLPTGKSLVFWQVAAHFTCLGAYKKHYHTILYCKANKFKTNLNTILLVKNKKHPGVALGCFHFCLLYGACLRYFAHSTSKALQRAKVFSSVFVLLPTQR
jgi:hypothetical protein